MFFTFKSKLLLGVYVFILVSIPIGAYLGSQTQIFRSRASEVTTKSKPITKVATSSAKLSAANSLLQQSQSAIAGSTSTPTPTPESDNSNTTTIVSSFGPTLSLKINIEGRPLANMATKLFVGIVEGDLGSNPKFLLSFNINVPANGVYSNLSLAGLTPGSKYTALLKGDSQVATSSAFTMSPNITNINAGEAVNMLSGDLNEDNTINASDFDIAQKALNSTSVSSNWNVLADINLDGIVNIIDLSIIKRNIGQIGASGIWSSPIPKTATSSASINTGTAMGSTQEGYWMWIPK